MSTATNKRSGNDVGLPQSHSPKKAKKTLENNCDFDSIQHFLQSNCKELVSRISELNGIEEYPDDEEEDYDEEALPTVNLFEKAKKLEQCLRGLKDVGDKQANRFRRDILLALNVLNEDPDEFDENTRTRGQCTEVQVEFFVEEWIALDEMEEEKEEEEEEEKDE